MSRKSAILSAFSRAWPDSGRSLKTEMFFSREAILKSFCFLSSLREERPASCFVEESESLKPKSISLVVMSVARSSNVSMHVLLTDF
jgi:hypothetical protein